MAAWLSLRLPRWVYATDDAHDSIDTALLIARRSRARGAGRRQSAALHRIPAGGKGLLYPLQRAVAWSQRVWSR